MKFDINGKEIEAKKLTVFQLTTEVSEYVKELIIQEAMQFAKHLEGKEKSEFLMSAYRDLPKGNELLERATKFLETVEGIKWMLSKAIEEEVEVNESNIDYFVPVIEYALGVESEGGEEEAEGKEVPFPEESQKED